MERVSIKTSATSQGDESRLKPSRIEEVIECRLRLPFFRFAAAFNHRGATGIRGRSRYDDFGSAELRLTEPAQRTGAPSFPGRYNLRDMKSDAPDPARGLSFGQAFEMLQKRFGQKRIECTVANVEVVPRVERPGHELLESLVLTWQQMKFLAIHPEIDPLDIADGRLPRGWPSSPPAP